MKKFSQLFVWGLTVSTIFWKGLTVLSVSYAADSSIHNSSHSKIELRQIASSPTEDERIFQKIWQYASDWTRRD